MGMAMDVMAVTQRAPPEVILLPHWLHIIQQPFYWLIDEISCSSLPSSVRWNVRDETRLHILCISYLCVVSSFFLYFSNITYVNTERPREYYTRRAHRKQKCIINCEFSFIFYFHSFTSRQLFSIVRLSELVAVE